MYDQRGEGDRFNANADLEAENRRLKKIQAAQAVGKSFSKHDYKMKALDVLEAVLKEKP